MGSRAAVVTQTAVLESAIAEERRQDGSLGVGPNINNNTVTAIITVVDIPGNYLAIAATVDDHPKPSLEGRGAEETVAVADVVAPVAAPVVETAAPEEPEPPGLRLPRSTALRPPSLTTLSLRTLMSLMTTSPTTNPTPRMPRFISRTSGRVWEPQRWPRWLRNRRTSQSYSQSR